jgi:hypothetical protein
MLHCHSNWYSHTFPFSFSFPLFVLNIKGLSTVELFLISSLILLGFKPKSGQADRVVDKKTHVHNTGVSDLMCSESQA